MTHDQTALAAMMPADSNFDTTETAVPAMDLPIVATAMDDTMKQDMQMSAVNDDMMDDGEEYASEDFIAEDRSQTPHNEIMKPVVSGPVTDFSSFDLPVKLQQALNRMEFTSPTPIQAAAIPIIMDGRDILGSAQTGTGKTGAFGIPLIARLMEDDMSMALILTPTRELATQVLATMRALINVPDLKTALLIGGEPMGKQIGQLRMDARVVVGTPGRVYDHLNRGTLKLTYAKYFVLDETDRMLDLGLGQQIEAIAEELPSERQTLMFSATMPSAIVRLANQYLTNPERIAVGSTTNPIAKIVQESIETSEGDKFDHLCDQLEKREGTVIIFVKTRFGADKLADKLSREGYTADAIHGDLQQRQRERVLRNFRDQRFRVLVATDVAARGLDIPHIAHVVNYDLPQCPEDYIHRIGRTGRAGAEGCALSLLTNADRGKWRAIQRLMGGSDASDQDNRRGGGNKGGKSFGGKKSFGGQGNGGGFGKKPFGEKRFERNDRPQRDDRFGNSNDRPQRDDRFGNNSDRPQRDDRFGNNSDRPQQERSYNRAENGNGHFSKKPFGDKPGFAKKPFGDRPERGDRFNNDRPERGDRFNNDRPQRDDRFGNSNDRPREERSFDRSEGDRGNFAKKPFGDKPGFAKKSFGDKPAFGKKPFGEKRFDNNDRPQRDDRFGNNSDRPQRDDRPNNDRPRDDRGERPRFEGNAQGERKPWQNRESTDGKKSFGEKKSYGDKPAFGKKPFGEKKSFGDKPAFGGKKTFGAKKPFGNKPRFTVA